MKQSTATLGDLISNKAPLNGDYPRVPISDAVSTKQQKTKQMKTILTLATLMFLTACGPGNHTQEQADAAYDLIRKGKVEELRKALEEKPSIANAKTKRDDTLLNIVIDTRPALPNYLATVEVLLEAGGDPNTGAPNLLRKAIWRGDPESVALLLKHGADPTVVWEKKKINMIDYAKSKNDKRFDKVFKTWEEQQKKG